MDDFTAKLEDFDVPQLRGKWVRFTWNLVTAKLPSTPPHGFQIARATPALAAEVLQLVTDAYASDPVWKSMLPAIKERMRVRIAETIADDNCEYLMLSRADKMVAVSGIALEHWTGQNLLTGICVLPAFQRQRLGTFLLGYSLRRLRARGRSVATVYTEHGSLADRKVYPLFGGRREIDVEYPGASARPQAIDHRPKLLDRRGGLRE